MGLAAAHLLGRAALPRELPGYPRCLREYGGTLLTVRVGVLATFLCTGLCRTLERLYQLGGESRGARAEREDGLTDLDDVLTQLDTLDHIGVRFLDTLVGIPATDLDSLCDRIEALSVLLWELPGVLALYAAGLLLLLVLLGLSRCLAAVRCL